MSKIVELISKISTVDDAKIVLGRQIEIDEDIESAIEFATVAHEGQFRKSGEPYIIHPILVASIVASTTSDKDMTIAALLHDVVEDTPFTFEDIEGRYGYDVALLVKGLTKIEELHDSNEVITDSNKRLIKSALSFKNMLLTSTKDSRVLIIKLCDRLHNMMTMDSQPESSQKRISEETLVVYTPIAHKLGMSKIKRLLEDLSFKYIYPDEYKRIDDYISSHKQDLNLKLNSFVESVKILLNENGFHRNDIEIEGRVKHYYSIYLKMQRKGVSIEEVLDLLAIRVVVKEPLLCYKALGILHLNYTPIIGRFKDYIALPKDNGYRTIHTTLFVDDSIIEAQIRTLHMHHIAECGIAAHWKYKGEEQGKVKLDWINEISSDNKPIVDFYESAKANLFSEEVVVFSPKGDKYTLPKGSVVLDFAYAIHTDIGNLATSAFVNKEKASLLTKLNSGDIVSIVTDEEFRVHCSWVDSVKTNRAKEGIRSICNQKLKEVNTKVALGILATIFNSSFKDIKDAIDALKLWDNIEKVPTNLGLLKSKIKKIAAYKNIKEVRFWELLKRGYKKPQLKSIKRFSFYTNRTIDGVEFDFCCHPKLGDDIVALYSRGGVVIHHKLCKKVYGLINEERDLLFVKWNIKKSLKYRVVVALQNDKGALLELLKEFNKLDLNIVNIELGIQSSDRAEYCRLEVESSSENSYNFKEIISKKFKVIDFTSLKDAYRS